MSQERSEVSGSDGRRKVLIYPPSRWSCAHGKLHFSLPSIARNAQKERLLEREQSLAAPHFGKKSHSNIFLNFRARANVYDSWQSLVPTSHQQYRASTDIQRHREDRAGWMQPQPTSGRQRHHLLHATPPLYFLTITSYVGTAGRECSCCEPSCHI